MYEFHGYFLCWMVVVAGGKRIFQLCQCQCHQDSGGSKAGIVRFLSQFTTALDSSASAVFVLTGLHLRCGEAVQANIGRMIPLKLTPAAFQPRPFCFNEDFITPVDSAVCEQADAAQLALSATPPRQIQSEAEYIPDETYKFWPSGRG